MVPARPHHHDEAKGVAVPGRHHRRLGIVATPHGYGLRHAQEALSAGQSNKLTYFAFDLLYAMAATCAIALVAPQRRPCCAFWTAGRRLMFSSHLEGDGPTIRSPGGGGVRRRETVGRYDGDTLIADTIGLSTKAFVDTAAPS
jgi:hypothetical protein